jgi:hypothetical protein
MPKGSPRQMGGRPYFVAGYKFFMLVSWLYRAFCRMQCSMQSWLGLAQA